MIPREGKKMNKFKAALASTAAAFAIGLALLAPGHAAANSQEPLPATPTPACNWISPAPQSGSPVIFVAAHPDDETLAMSVPIAEHAGQDVHVLILTSGGASGALALVNNQLSGTAYAPLTQAEFMAAREGEATRAVSRLGCPFQVKLHFGHLEDGQVTTASAKAAILALADELTSGPVRLKGHSYITAVEPHADHRAVGNAIVALGSEQPARFGDRRFYVLPHSWGYTGALPGKAWDYPANADVTTKVHMAADAYCLWAPPASYNIGCLSVPGLFATLNASPKALMHQ